MAMADIIVALSKDHGDWCLGQFKVSFDGDEFARRRQRVACRRNKGRDGFDYILDLSLILLPVINSVDAPQLLRQLIFPN